MQYVAVVVWLLAGRVMGAAATSLRHMPALEFVASIGKEELPVAVLDSCGRVASGTIDHLLLHLTFALAYLHFVVPHAAFFVLMEVMRWPYCGAGGFPGYDIVARPLIATRIWRVAAPGAPAARRLACLRSIHVLRRSRTLWQPDG